MSDETTAGPARRTVLQIAGGLAAFTFLAGCGGQSDTTTAGQGPDVEKIRTAVDEAVAGGKLEVGKALFLEDAGVVVTRPAAAQYKVFSSVCPHANGRVTEQDPETGRLVCLLHGSQFDPKTGEVVVGPSAAGLKDMQVPVSAPTA